jgi:hypothetical protein
MSATEELCDGAVEALDRALRDQPDRLYDDVAEAVRCLVRFRDEMIERQRSDPDAETGGRLRRANAILSLVVGGEYPIAGLHRERLEKARDALDKLRKEGATSGA